MSSFAPGYSRPHIFNGASTVRDFSSVTPHCTSPIICMRLSPDGRFLAIGDGDGTVEIRAFRRGSWRCTCLYVTGGAVRTLVWHPTESGTVFSGSANGALHKITVVAGAENILCDALVPGYIHLLQISPDGQRLVIAHGRSLSFVQNPFPQHTHVGTLLTIDTAPPVSSRLYSHQYIPRAIFFLDNSSIIVAYLGRKGLRTFSLPDQQCTGSVPLRQNSLIGSAAISPSGERIAVMNLRDGIDFYSTSRREYVNTTKYTMSTQVPPRNFIVDIVFVDDDTVAFGHSDGYVGFATFGVHHVDTTFEMTTAQTAQGIAPVQVITFGLVGNTPLLFALASPPDPAPSQRSITPNIHIGQINTPGLHHLDLDHTAAFYAQRSPRWGMARVLVVLGTITATWLAFVAGRALGNGHETQTGGGAAYSPSTYTLTPTPRIPTVIHTEDISAITSAFDPATTCICTVTGTIDAAKESSGIVM